MSDQAHFSIGEFSRMTGLTVKALRFYHERRLLVPARVDPHTGYRVYDRRNLETASVIRALRDLEVPLEHVADILAECSDDRDALAYLERHRAELARKLEHARGLIERIDQAIDMERQAQAMAAEQQTFEITEREVEPVLVAGLRMRGRYDECGTGFSQVAKRAGRYLAGNPLCLYYDGEYKEEDADFEPCFPLRKPVALDGLDVRELPGCRCVALIHRGPYDTLRLSYARVMTYAKERGYAIDLPTREVYLKGPGMIFKGNPKKYLTEIQLPIKE